MNPFNPLSIVQSTFESDDVQHELKELVDIASSKVTAKRILLFMIVDKF